MLALKNKSDKAWAFIFTLPLCGNRCRFSESRHSQVPPPMKMKLNQNGRKLKHPSYWVTPVPPFLESTPKTSSASKMRIDTRDFCAILYKFLEFPNAVVLNAVVRRKSAKERKRAQMSAKERKRKCAKVRKRAQKCTKERKRALTRKNCKQPGLKQPGLGTPKNWQVGGCQFTFWRVPIYIWRLNLSWGCSTEKGGSAKGGVL